MIGRYFVYIKPPVITPDFGGNRQRQFFGDPLIILRRFPDSFLLATTRSYPPEDALVWLCRPAEKVTLNNRRFHDHVFKKCPGHLQNIRLPRKKQATHCHRVTK
ncbi:MAG: hypothetical protein ACLTKQ_08025 [Acutalibacteraceae bacterium]